MLQDRYSLAFKLYPYARSADQDKPKAARHPVIVMGAGPIGLATALDLGRQGVPVLVLDDHEGIGKGSRAICFSKRTLEIADRYGCGSAMLDKGVVWSVGKVFHDDRQVFEFNLLPEDGHRNPAFINLQQPYFERFLFEQIQTEIAKGAPIEIRGRNRVETVTPNADRVALTVQTPEGSYQLEADWLIGCDGANSPLRGMMGLDFEGRVFKDSFLIADIRMLADYPTERWFWFEPHFKSGASALMHRQPDDIWRIDFQIGWDADRKEELKEDNIRKRLDAMLGDDVEYELVWSSIYTFQCKRMEKFRHGRVIFAGDSAHQVSPFGARGANSGMQDVDNLGWKLGLVVQGKAPESLLDSYSEERVYGAEENIRNSTRSTDFITPKSKNSYCFRNAVLDLSERFEFARPFVNSGRLSVPCTYDGLSLNGSDAVTGPARSRVGSACPDAPVAGGYLLDMLGTEFVLLGLGMDVPKRQEIDGIIVKGITLDINDPSLELLRARYLGTAPQAVYLIRPDQHVAARWTTYDDNDVASALARACGKEELCLA
ncbi:FAD-dependent oxidoreductase [Cognatishimia sp. SS12]|uniref:FAD-dependent oxidoreductase n=1 Tax=Cognatishimia sp. SS12 TaxID=2979465 RepID=UPI00232B9380|nr:FAD-dependent oxidoreductase [Cognatishimia sp. SS12]MDC0739573.1 FAD-dependent oxidoreductase [Cognatishimia sp. SS12]